MTLPRCYLLRDVLGILRLSRTQFYQLLKRGQFPFEELQPRIGQRMRFRADLIDRYAAGEWSSSRQFLRSHRRIPAWTPRS